MEIKTIKIEDKNYPEKLRKIKNPPKIIYILGNEKLLENQSLAIVGSRDCSEYGIKYAKQFTKEIAQKGITIISGLALGIDTVAHEMAKEYKGKTIAVVGCGLNHMYPKENRQLFQSILEKGGCILSEYEPETPVNMKNFPKRNRIISGLSDGVLIIEAGYRSGSTITGRLGIEQEKKVFCLPRDLGISKGIGSNELLQKGAKLVTCAQDILQEYGIKDEILKKEVRKNKEMSEEYQRQIPKEYINVYEFISYTPQNIQYLAKRSGLKIAEVTQKLIMLELQGYIKSMPRKLLYTNIKFKYIHTF